MEMNRSMKTRIKNLQDIKSLDLLKYELYAILTTILLSKEEFKSNKDINDFLNLFGISFREYVFQTRTLVLARTLRIVEKAEIDTLEQYKSILIEFYLKDKDDKDLNIKDKKKLTENYMNKILNKYSRNKE